MRNLLFLLFPLLCLCLSPSQSPKPKTQSCTQLQQTLGLGSSQPPENIGECNTEGEGEEGGRKEGIGSNCSCKAGFKKCRLSLIPESRLDALHGPEIESKTLPQTAGKDVLEVDGMRFLRKYEDESLSDLRLGENHCNFCCRDNNSNNTNQKATKERKLGTALTAGVMLGMIVVVVLISIAASKLSKCSSKTNSEEMQEPETKTITNTV